MCPRNRAPWWTWQSETCSPVIGRRVGTPIRLQDGQMQRGSLLTC